MTHDGKSGGVQGLATTSHSLKPNFKHQFAARIPEPFELRLAVPITSRAEPVDGAINGFGSACVTSFPCLCQFALLQS
jgi:hypothetical protein